MFDSFDPRKDYWRILKLSPEASDKEIRASFLRLAKEYHPDTNPTAKNMFSDVAEAKAVLLDPSKRGDWSALRRKFQNGGWDPSGGAPGSGSPFNDGKARWTPPRAGATPKHISALEQFLRPSFLFGVFPVLLGVAAFAGSYVWEPRKTRISNDVKRVSALQAAKADSAMSLAQRDFDDRATRREERRLEREARQAKWSQGAKP
ncbi:hypothetical protein TeGR_g9358 [Tetraparma gracilis]|uniref:J domain-containing protein n=1 Tax=Tetraparma gracilis TaxID=2962635 RepID=A0ABQ6MC44_9STRA|nr:hypothetical protein TeGR_g9358 [Tetraparma gracilis]